MCRWPFITSFPCISFSSVHAPIGIFTNIGFYSSISREETSYTGSPALTLKRKSYESLSQEIRHDEGTTV